MYTVPTHRGKGVATEIFRRTVEEAKASGCGRISLNATEMGRPLYEKFGFEPSHDEMVLTLG
ncbi:MAG: GNAT family N-acetyltransferase, partial [Clostridia bacterium]|nr:GNAT family N-acetyltransferase [Clostridia bacterium]